MTDSPARLSAEEFLRLTGLIARPGVLFTPRMVARILRSVISGRFGVPAQPYALSARALALLRGLPIPEATVGPAPWLPAEKS